MKSESKAVEIITNGITIWISRPDGLIGRFGRLGIDIHRVLRDSSIEGECLFCTHARTTAEDWVLFVEKMKEYHGIEVSERYRPVRFSEPS